MFRENDCDDIHLHLRCHNNSFHMSHNLRHIHSHRIRSNLMDIFIFYSKNRRLKVKLILMIISFISIYYFHLIIPISSSAFVSEEFWLLEFCITIPKMHVIFAKEIKVLVDTKCLVILYFILAAEPILLHYKRCFCYTGTKHLSTTRSMFSPYFADD